MPRFRLMFILTLSLALPWSGCEYIHQKEQLMRSAEGDRLQRQAQALAESIKPLFSQQQNIAISTDQADGLYLYTLPDTILLDGSADDWSLRFEPHMTYPNRLEDPVVQAAQELVAMAGQNHHHMFLFFQVPDHDSIYVDPLNFDQPSDHLLIDLKNHPLAGRYRVQVTAPGKFQALRKQQHDSSTAEWVATDHVQGYWQDTATGYNLELRLPLATSISELGFNVYDFDPVANRQGSDHPVANIEITTEPKLTAHYTNQVQTKTPVPLIQTRPDLQKLLETSDNQTTRIHIIDPGGWVLAHKYHQTSSVPVKDLSSFNQALFDILSQIYLFISHLRDPPEPLVISGVGRLQGPNVETAAKGMTTNHWYKKPRSNQAVMSIAYPVKDASQVLAIIIIEQNSSAFLSLQNPDFLRNIAYSLLAIVILSLLMFIYTWKLARQLLQPSPGQSP